ncbi:MAG: 23S rRNA (pseudouridine(1915)-N(3))-methyltransferase RlmH [Lachnospiraceae bacterium]|nr:23S rRNA (pseudouridine(1915)-N(3))-methyltransferase RlmH [Lachnospiraceae bacterium]
MNITILCVGKLKENFYKDALAEYAKRLSPRYASFRVTEVDDEKTAENASEKEEMLVKEKEGERLLSRIPEKAYVIALAIQGKMLDSVELSEKMRSYMNGGRSEIIFVIGGSLGLSPAVLKRADEQWSFSKLTFPHQLMRVILAEQIYRGFRILHHEPYHK